MLVAACVLKYSLPFSTTRATNIIGGSYYIFTITEIVFNMGLYMYTSLTWQDQ